MAASVDADGAAIFDLIGSRHMRGERPLVSAKLLKFNKRGRPEPRVLVLTDRALGDFTLAERSEDCKLKQQLGLAELTGYSQDAGAGANGGASAFVVHYTAKGRPATLLFASSEAASLCQAISDAFKERINRPLRQLDWDEESAAIISKVGTETLATHATQITSGRGRSSTTATVALSEQQRESLMRRFESGQFDVDAYTGELLQQKSLDGVKLHLGELRWLREHAAARLQTSVFRHYGTFIKTSNEIAELDEDIDKIRGQLRAIGEAMAALGDTMHDINGQTRGEELVYGEEQPDACVCEMQSQMVTLEVLIAERHFDQAMKALDTANALFAASPAQLDDFGTPLQGQSNSLMRLLLREVELPKGQGVMQLTRSQDETQRLLKYLVKLGCAKQAKEMFFNNQNNAFEEHVREIKFQGDIALYVNELSHVAFKSIRLSSDRFRSLFLELDRAQQTSFSSAFVRWAVGSQLQRFCSDLRRYLLLADSIAVQADCIIIALAHCKILERHGMMFSPHIVQSLAPDVIRCIQLGHDSHSRDIEEAVRKENWAVSAFDVAGTGKETATLRMSTSGRTLYEHIMPFISAVGTFPSELQLCGSRRLDGTMGSVYMATVDAARAIVDDYAQLLEKFAFSERCKPPQMLGMLMTMSALGADLLPRTAKLLSDEFARPVRELQPLTAQLAERRLALRDKFIEQVVGVVKGKHLSRQVLQAMYADVPKAEADSITMTANMQVCLKLIMQLVGLIQKVVVAAPTVLELMVALVARLAVVIDEESTTEGEPTIPPGPNGPGGATAPLLHSLTGDKIERFLFDALVLASALDAKLTKVSGAPSPELHAVVDKICASTGVSLQPSQREQAKLAAAPYA